MESKLKVLSDPHRAIIVNAEEGSDLIRIQVQVENSPRGLANLEKSKAKTTPTMESITRCRRKYQEKGLFTGKYQADRLNAESEMHEHFSDEHLDN